MVRVNFRGATASFFGNSLGMMGSFEIGEMLARDGETVLDDPNAFGHEWQVLDTEPQLFQDKNRFPQFPMKDPRKPSVVWVPRLHRPKPKPREHTWAKLVRSDASLM